MSRNLAQVVDTTFAACVVTIAIRGAIFGGLFIGDYAIAVLADFSGFALAIQFAGGQAGIVDTFVTGGTICVGTAFMFTNKSAGAIDALFALGTIGVGTTLEFANRRTLIIDAFMTFSTILVGAALELTGRFAGAAVTDLSFRAVFVGSTQDGALTVQADLALGTIGVIDTTSVGFDALAVSADFSGFAGRCAESVRIDTLAVLTLLALGTVGIFAANRLQVAATW